MLKPKLPKPEQGFTMVEVLVAILIAMIFVAVAMQVMALAAVFRVRAQEYSETTNWIQEDLEKVKFEASQFGIKPVSKMSASNDPATPSVNEKDLINILNHGFANGEPIVFQGEGIAGGLETNKLYYVVINPSIPDSTNNFKVTDAVDGAGINLTSDSSGNLIAVAATRCGTLATPTTPTTGYADGLRDLISNTNVTNEADVSHDVVNPASSGNSQTAGTNLSSKLFTEKKFQMKRTTTIPNMSPYSLLKLDYTVSPILPDGTVDTTPIATFHTEVIPNAALQCPN